MRIRHVPLSLRLAIGTRDNWTCQICGRGFDPARAWVIDHWLALANGGTNHLSNLRLAHDDCNVSKGAA